MLMNATPHAVIIIFFMNEYFRVKTTTRYENIVPCFNRSILKVLNCGLQNRFYSGEFFVGLRLMVNMNLYVRIKHNSVIIRAIVQCSTIFPLKLSLSPSPGYVNNS